MNTISKCLPIFLLMTLGCHTDNNQVEVSPIVQSNYVSSGELLPQGYSGASGRLSTATANPVLTKVSGTSCGECPPSMPADYVPIDWATSQILIDGINLGATQGKSIVIAPANGSSQTLYKFSFISWTDKRIVLGSVAASTAVPLTFKLTVTTYDGLVVSTNFTAVPTINGRYYNTPNWYADTRRISFGLQPQPRGYSYTGLLGNDYSPIRGDVWQYGGQQQSIVISASTQVVLLSQDKAGKVENVTYNVILEEMNNGRVASISRGITYRRTTTVFTNAPARVSNTLVTPASSAFASSVPGVAPATRFYR